MLSDNVIPGVLLHCTPQITFINKIACPVMSICFYLLLMTFEFLQLLVFLLDQSWRLFLITTTTKFFFYPFQTN